MPSPPYCIKTDKVYDWISFGQTFSVAASIPIESRPVREEVCGCFSNPTSTFDKLWQSRLSVNLKGTVTVCMTEGSLDDLEIAVNGAPINIGTDRKTYTGTFDELYSLEIRSLSGPSTLKGRFCLTLNYMRKQEVEKPEVERCFLSDCYGNEVPLESLICEEAGERRLVPVQLPDGNWIDLYQLTILKKGFLGIQLKGRKCICVIAFKKIEKVLLCAPPGTSITCSAQDFDCRFCSIQQFENCWCLKFDLTICQNIQSIYKVTVSIDGEECHPRVPIEMTTCQVESVDKL